MVVGDGYSSPWAGGERSSRDRDPQQCEVIVVEFDALTQGVEGALEVRSRSNGGRGHVRRIPEDPLGDGIGRENEESPSMAVPAATTMSAVVGEAPVWTRVGWPLNMRASLNGIEQTIVHPAALALSWNTHESPTAAARQMRWSSRMPSDRTATVACVPGAGPLQPTTARRSHRADRLATHRRPWRRTRRSRRTTTSLTVIRQTRPTRPAPMRETRTN